jgi:hypothetical protein
LAPFQSVVKKIFGLLKHIYEVFSKSQVISYIETKSPMRMCRRSFRTSPDDDLMSGKGAQ